MKSCPVCHLSYPDDGGFCYVDGSPLRVETDPRVGSLLGGRYVIDAFLGEGGMATVYAGRNKLVDEQVAVKVMHAHLCTNEVLKRRFHKEARSAAALHHANIIEIYDDGVTEDGEPYLVMELVEGKTLRDLLASGKLDYAPLMDIAIQTSRGLARAHDFFVIHRDLKPENLLLMEDEPGRRRVKLADFGLAKATKETQRLTRTGEIVGTPEYLAPERIRGEEDQPSSDLYALGVILFEMITGHLPIESENLAGFIYGHLNTEAPPIRSLRSDCPESLANLVASLLEKDVANRPVDAHQVVRQLEKISKEMFGRSASARYSSIPGRRASREPNTFSADQWGVRIGMLEELIRHPLSGDGGRMDLMALGELQMMYARHGRLREAAYGVENALNELGMAAAETRGQLGRAVQEVGKDMSVEREGVQLHEEEIQRLRVVAEQAAESFRQADAGLARLRIDREATPSETELTVAELSLSALQRWRGANASIEHHRARIAEASSRVDDLAFQIETLRARLREHEASYQTRSDELNARMRENGLARRELEEAMLAELRAIVRTAPDDERFAKVFEDFRS